MDVKLWFSFDLALFHFDVKTPFVLTGYGPTWRSGSNLGLLSGRSGFDPRLCVLCSQVDRRGGAWLRL